VVIWIIGMSGSGKTTIGRKLYEKINQSNEKWIFLDGDTFRNILGEDLGHSIEDRKQNGYRISRFCEFLSSQRINVIACVLSIFHKNQKYNREKIQDYKEIFVDVTMEKLLQRDNKKLYAKAINGEIRNVVGVDIEFIEPYAPDFILKNNIDNVDFESIIDEIIREFNINKDDDYSYTKTDLLEKPHKYQYSLYEGEVFFIKYLKDRNNSISFLNDRFDKLKMNNYIFSGVNYSANYIKDDSIILKNYLFFLLNENKISEQKNHLNILSTIIKRFEVSKKLHNSYDIFELRKNNEEYDNILNYALFSLVLQKVFFSSEKEEHKMIYLNSILKLNDILSSVVKTKIILPVEISYTLRALMGEMEITKKYLC
tara:strand:+ start:249 stop:1358 length:1110 start_codon:yes stop_codon:yes gene_type:complete